MPNKKQNAHAGEITAAAKRLFSSGLFTPKNKALIIEYPEYAIDTASILRNLYISDKTLLNDKNRQYLHDFIKSNPDKISTVSQRCQKLNSENALTQDAFENLVNVKLAKEAFLMGTHPRVGATSSIFQFFGSHVNSSGNQVSNNELTERQLPREIFKFL